MFPSVTFHRMRIVEGEGMLVSGGCGDRKEASVKVYVCEHRLELTLLKEIATAYLDNDEVAETCNMGQSQKRAIERLTIRVMLRVLLGSNAQLAYDENGAPHVSGSEKNASYISISHSAGLYALSLSRFRHGLDFEAWGKKAFRVRDKFLRAQELYWLSECPSKCFSNSLSAAQRATLLWCAKESVYKCANDSAISLLSGIILETQEEYFKLTARLDGREYGERFYLGLFADDSYAGAVCMADSQC